jgi:hypothetical protein
MNIEELREIVDLWSLKPDTHLYNEGIFQEIYYENVDSVPDSLEKRKLVLDWHEATVDMDDEYIRDEFLKAVWSYIDALETALK